MDVSGIRVDRVESESAWDQMQFQWDELFRMSPTASPALQFDWMRLWWHHYKDAFTGSKLCILRAWRGERLIGLLPLFKRRSRAGVGARRLGFLSTGEAEREETCPEYLDQLHVPGEEASCAGAFWAAIRRLRWDMLALKDMRASSEMVRAVGQQARVRIVSRGICPQADLSGGYEAYLARLSANGRQKARSLLRKADQAGAMLSLTDAGSVPDEMYRTLEILHQSRWARVGLPGVFGEPRFSGFHKDLVRLWVPKRLALIAVLELERTPVAALYGHLQGSTFFFYQSGIAVGASGALQQPGLAAHLMLMQRLAQNGVQTYDFLRGSAEYKMRLATGSDRLVELTMQRRTMRTLTSRGALLARRAARRLLHKGRHE